MNMLFKYLIFIFVSFIIVSCSSGRIDKLDRKPDEAVVFGKLKLLNHNKNIARDIQVSFDGSFSGRYTVELDGLLYFYLKLPIGKHYISRIQIKDDSQRIPEYLINFDTPESKIYYIGDITLKMKIEKKWGDNMGLFLEYAYMVRHGENPDIQIEDNFESAKTYFTELFPVSEEIFKSIALMDSSKLYIPKSDWIL